MLYRTYLLFIGRGIIVAVTCDYTRHRQFLKNNVAAVPKFGTLFAETIHMEAKQKGNPFC